jgi:Zn-dependent M28 family amino/carboxypeptidase
MRVVMRFAAAVLCATSALVTSAAQTNAGTVDRARLMRDVRTFADPAFEGRRAGSAGGAKARQWLVEQFTEIGLTPAGSAGYLQPFTAVQRDTRAAVANVIGRVRGTDPRATTIVVTAHYDHLGVRGGMIYHGADDNASGVTVLLAAARHFVAHPPRHTMRFAALDAEEIGHRGASALITSGLLRASDVALNVNLDMLSRSDTNEIYAAGTYHYPWLTPILDEIRMRAAVKILYGHDRPPPPGGGLDDWTTLSDHGEFHKAGIPFVYFGVEDHPDYHKPTDTADKIDPRFFGDVADMVLQALRTFDTRVP